jgi:DNA-binding transcriptional regulator LsrR (DeoR family)
VEISVVDPLATDAWLGSELCARLGLRQAVVVPARGRNPAVVRRHPGFWRRAS